MTQKAKIWRYIWLLPLTLFGIALLVGSSFVFSEVHSRGFLMVRILIYISMLLTCFVLESMLRQVSENALLKASTRMDGDTLFIVVSNSFDGLWSEKNGAYLSRKEAEDAREGTGLPSVKAACEKHRGMAQYKITGEAWKSSPLVHMG